MPAKKPNRRRSLAVLSPREKQVVRLVADGIGTVPISKKLDISDKTVRTHLQNLYDKLGVSDRAAAVAEAMRRGLLE